MNHLSSHQALSRRCALLHAPAAYAFNALTLGSATAVDAQAA